MARDWKKLSEGEKWSPELFYEYMRFHFRPDRGDDDGHVGVPFYKHRPLVWIEWSDGQKRHELYECQKRYVQARLSIFLKRLSTAQAGRASHNPSPERWPDLLALGLPQESFWPYESALGRLYFADTDLKQAQARKEVKGLARKGLIPLRTAMKKARSRTHAVKREFSAWEIFELRSYRAERQFLWAFLRHEAQWNPEGLHTPDALMDAAHTLATAYPYLGLTADAIAQGLNDPRQANKDAAKKFGVSASSVPSLLSRSARR